MNKKKSIGTVIKEKLKDYFRYIMILVAVVFIFSLMGNIVKIRNINSRVERAQERVDKLKAENAELEIRVGEVKNDFFVEKKLRDSLGLAKEGEIVIVLPDEDVLRKLAPKGESKVEELPEANWEKWIEIFM